MTIISGTADHRFPIFVNRHCCLKYAKISTFFLSIGQAISRNWTLRLLQMAFLGAYIPNIFRVGACPADPLGCLTPSTLDCMTTHMTLTSPLERRAQMKARLMYISINKLAPQRLSNFFQNSNTVYDYNLRGSSTIN